MSMHAFLRFVYLLLAMASCTYLATANLRGWSAFQPFLPKSSLVHGAPVRHK